MLIRSVDPARLVDAYDVKEQMFYPWSEVAATPFGSHGERSFGEMASLSELFRMGVWRSIPTSRMAPY